jgi:divalent metal cation (Fe/Co/Zn/Cd) transporter
MLRLAAVDLAWALTGSVGLLSDAAESVVNLVAAMFALAALHWALASACCSFAPGERSARSPWRLTAST